MTVLNVPSCIVITLNNERRRVRNSQLTVSISTTVLKAFSERPEMGAKKFPAAPIADVITSLQCGVIDTLVF